MHGRKAVLVHVLVVLANFAIDWLSLVEILIDVFKCSSVIAALSG
jgi:hypothetical protein